MTDVPNDVDIETTDDLDKFSDALFNTTQETEEVVDEEKEGEEDVTEDDTLAPDEDIDADEESDDDEDDAEEEEAEEEPKPQAKKNRKSAKDRIEELVAEARQAQRERDLERRERELIAKRLEAIEAQAQKEAPKEEDKPLRTRLPEDAPSPDAVDKEGNPIYELGEFDPNYILDLTKYFNTKERETENARRAQEAEAAKIEAAQAELRNTWTENLEKSKDELPDFQEKVQSLETVVANIDPAYGDYLASVLMSSDVGPQIMYYLSENIGEAQEIVASGPAAATRAIGRLEAQFSSTKREGKRNTEKKVSDAPKPPEQRARGTNARITTRGDTPDLNAFEKEFFKKK